MVGTRGANAHAQMNIRTASSLCFVLFTGCLTADDDPSLSTDERAIMNPSLAGPYDLLGVVSVNGNCSGELISSNTVLTAAHCVCNAGTCGTTAAIRFRREPASLLPWKPDDGGIVGRVRVHPSYTGGKQYDLATITFDASAPGFALPFQVSSTLPTAGSALMIAGFGFTGSSCTGEIPFPWLFWDANHFDRYRVYPSGPPTMQWDDEVYCHGDSGGAALLDDATLNPNVLVAIEQGAADWSIPYGVTEQANPTAPYFAWIKAAVCPSTSQNSCNGNGWLCACTGSSNLLWQNRTTGDFAIWTMDGGRATSTPTVQQAIPLGWKIAGSGDFDGDRQADILWRYQDSVTTSTAIWRMVGTTHVSDFYPADLGRTWEVEAVADFDANGRADILWGNTATGEHRLWKNGDPTSTRQKVSYQNAGANVSTAWVVKGAGDFNGDGKADVFWENNDGNTAIWLMNGSTWIGELSFGPRGGGYGFQGIGDFNGDARADVLWRGINDDLKIWFNGGGVVDGAGTVQSTACGGGTPNGPLARCTIASGPSWNNQYVNVPGDKPFAKPTAVSTAWVIDRIADFNHDGRDDLLWRSGSSMAIWYLDGTRFIGETDPRMPGETGPHWFDPAWVTTGVSRQPNF